MKIKRTLISVSDKTGLVNFARGLSEMGVEIISTGGTAKTLKDADIPVIDVSTYTGSPEMMDGRVKTLHPKIHGGILARRHVQADMTEAAKHGIGMIDMVVVNLYPFEKTIAKPNCTFEDAIENIDIGGPTMIRAAAKNFESVVVVVDPHDYDMILKKMSDNGQVDRETRLGLAKKVFELMSRYDGTIADYLARAMGEDGDGTDV